MWSRLSSVCWIADQKPPPLCCVYTDIRQGYGSGSRNLTQLTYPVLSCRMSLYDNDARQTHGRRRKYIYFRGTKNIFGKSKSKNCSRRMYIFYLFLRLPCVCRASAVRHDAACRILSYPVVSPDAELSQYVN